MRWRALGFAAALGVGCASSPRFPAPRVAGSLVDGAAPVSGAEVLVCFTESNGSCSQPEHSARTDAKGAFAFERGAWGQVAPYQVIGPSWRLSVVEGHQARVLLVGPLIGDPTSTYIAVHCDVSADPAQACGAEYIVGP
jgi:hypothetical protein